MPHSLRRPPILLAERFVLWAWALAVCLPGMASRFVVELVVVLAALFVGRLLVSERRGRQLFALSAPLLCAMFVLAALADGTPSRSVIGFAFAGAALTAMLLAVSPTTPLSEGALVWAALPVVLFVPALRSPLWAAVVFSTMAFVLAGSGAYHAKPRLADRSDVREALEGFTPRPGSVELSVILPTYNTGERLASTLQRIRAVFAGAAVEIIVVDDGSTDGAPADLPTASDLVVLRKRNGGKGSAIAAGVLVARGPHIAFLDADGDIDPSHLVTFLEAARSDGAALVVGSKRAAGAAYDVSRLRRVWSWGFQTIQRTLLPTGVADSQVGAKLADAHLMRDAVIAARENRFLLDVELLCYANRSKARVLELPVTVRHDGSSTVSTRTALRMLAGMLALFAARLTGSYQELLHSQGITDAAPLHA